MQCSEDMIMEHSYAIAHDSELAAPVGAVSLASNSAVIHRTCSRELRELRLRAMGLWRCRPRRNSRQRAH